MSLRTPLARVRGHGSAKEGPRHWWAQRMSAVALIPLTLWFVASLLSLATADYALVVEWVRQPLVTVLLVLLLGALFYHAQLGIQVVFEDYVHVEWLKIANLIVLKLLSVLLAVVAIFCVLRIALGG